MSVYTVLGIIGGFVVGAVLGLVAARRRNRVGAAARQADAQGATAARWYPAKPVRYSSIDDALTAAGALPIDYAAVQGLLTKLHPTADQSRLSDVATAVCRAAFVHGIVGVEQDMRAVRDFHDRLEAATGLFREFPYLKTLNTVEGERGKMVRVALRNEIEEHVLVCWAEWRSTTLGAPVVVLAITRDK